MKRTHRWVMVCFCSLSVCAQAQDAANRGAHRHDSATLQITVEGGRMTIELESPAVNVIGFEHEPFTMEERAAAQSASTWLQQRHGLFQMPEEAACRVTASLLEPPDWTKWRREQRERDAVTREVFEDSDLQTAPPGHADYRARYQIDCEHPEQLKWLEVLMLDRFRGPVRVDAEVVTPTGQKRHAVSKETNRVPLE